MGFSPAGSVPVRLDFAWEGARVFLSGLFLSRDEGSLNFEGLVG